MFKCCNILCTHYYCVQPWAWPSTAGLDWYTQLHQTSYPWMFPALRKQGWKQKLLNSEPITRLADCMERRLELGVTWQSTKTGQTCSSKTSAAPTMNSSTVIDWLLAPPFTKAWYKINKKYQPQRNCFHFFGKNTLTSGKPLLWMRKLPYSV